MDQVVVYKEAVAQHALEDACLLRSQNRLITAHILASAAFDVIQHVARDATSFSIIAAFWKAAKEIGRQKEMVKKVNQASNFFKHADKDINEVICFDKTLTDHFIYLAILDLKRTKECRPERDGYRLLVAPEVEKFHRDYLALRCKDSSSLVALEEIVAHKDDAREGLCVEHIRNWLQSRTDISTDNRSAG